MKTYKVGEEWDDNTKDAIDLMASLVDEILQEEEFDVGNFILARAACHMATHPADPNGVMREELFKYWAMDEAKYILLDNESSVELVFKTRNMVD